MKLGILKADSVLQQFQSNHGDYPDMFMRRLGDAADQAFGNRPEFVVYDVEHGEYPAQIDECDGYVITGSKKSVYDGDAWIKRLEKFVLALHVAEKPLAGICFGHQLVAQALGGKTEPAEVGWGVGVHTSEVLARKSFMQPAIDSVNVLVSHKDQVSLLPEGAEVLASSEFCPIGMYQIGEHIFCMQGHPEFVSAYSEELMTMREEILGEAVFAAGIASLQSELDSDKIALWILNFLQAAHDRYAVAG